MAQICFSLADWPETGKSTVSPCQARGKMNCYHRQYRGFARFRLEDGLII